MQESNPFAADQHVNPYAAPTAQSQPLSPQSTDGIWRNGNILIIHRQATLPTSICIKSNEPTDGYRLKRKLSWHPPWIAITILISPLIYIILALIMSKRATIFLSLSEEWRSKRRFRILVGWVLFGLGFAGMVTGIAMLDPRGNQNLSLWLLFGGILLMIGSALYGLIGSRMVSPSKIEGDYIYIKGAHPEFLERFPPASPTP